MIPTIGRIVIYTLTSMDAEAINRRREHAAAHMAEHRANSTGVMVHVGNEVYQGQEFPMIITRVWGPDAGSAVNGTVLLDGSDTFWVCSAVVDQAASDEPRTSGMYRWPVRS